MVSTRQRWICTTIEDGLDWSIFFIIFTFFTFYLILNTGENIASFFSVLSVPIGIVSYGFYRIITEDKSAKEIFLVD